MDAFDRDVLATNVSSDGRIVVRCNDPLVFVGSAHKQAGEFEIDPPLQSYRCFLINIDPHRDKLQFAFWFG